MEVVHYMDTEEWCFACDRSRKDLPTDRPWTFEAQRVTCPECLRDMAPNRRAAVEHVGGAPR